MNTTYTLTEGNDALNRVLLMMSYDLSKTLDEQKIPTDKDLQKYQQGEYENAVGKYVDKTATSFRGPDGKQKTTATSPKMLKGITPTESMTFDEFMEYYRESLFSLGGMAIEAFLTSTGYGAIPVVTAWGLLLWYDVKKGIDTGEWVWENIVIDILMVASAGALGFGLKAIVSSGKWAGKGLSEIIEFLVKTKGYENIVKWLKTLSSKTPEIINGMKTGIKWLSNSILTKGVKYFTKGTINLIWKGLQGVGYVITKIGVLINKMSSIIEKSLTKLGVTGKLGKGLGAAGGITAFNLGIKAIEEIHNKWVQMGKDATLKSNNEKFLIEANQKIYGKDIIYNYIDGKYTIKMKRDVNGVYYTYSDKYKEWQEVYPDEYTSEQLQSTIRSGLFGRTDLKFDEFEILDRKNNIYEINNNKYQLIPGNDFKLKKIK